MESPTRAARRATANADVSSTGATAAADDWCIVPDPLLSRITQLRHQDGHRKWSYESMGDRVGRTGASVRKIVTGRTRQPDLDVVEGLAKLRRSGDATSSVGGRGGALDDVTDVLGRRFKRQQRLLAGAAVVEETVRVRLCQLSRARCDAR